MCPNNEPLVLLSFTKDNLVTFMFVFLVTYCFRFLDGGSNHHPGFFDVEFCSLPVHELVDGAVVGTMAQFLTDSALNVEQVDQSSTEKVFLFPCGVIF